ncbi:unnamed protein product, partial [marine sediment metagenome]
IRDGLDDYDDDFTRFELLGSIVTADMKHQAQMRLLRAAEDKEQEEHLAATEILENNEEEPGIDMEVPEDREENLLARQSEDDAAAESGRGS